MPVLLLLGLLALAVLPWYGERIDGAALALVATQGRWWLAPPLVALGLVAIGWCLPRSGVHYGRVITAGALAGVVWTLVQGFAVGMNGLDWAWFGLLGPVTQGQPGFGWGAFLLLAVFTVLLSQGVAGLGRFRGDGFVSGAVWSIAVLVAIFVFFPVARVLLSAFTGPTGVLDLALAWGRLSAPDIWS